MTQPPSEPLKPRPHREGLARLIDANANRAAEALRVADDLARFVVDSKDLCAQFKSIRHELRTSLSLLPLDSGHLLAARDTPGDAGTGVGPPPQTHPLGPADLAAAAAGRVAEALRSIEEASKALGSPACAATVESLRYRSYIATQRLRLALGTGRARQWRLCVLITESLCLHHPWERVAELAMDAGADCVQLREKSLDSRTLLARAKRLVAIARGHASTIINDRADIALLAGADGVHVGQSDLSLLDVRKIAGFSLLVGVSTSSIAHARAAAHDGADYCGVGPMFASQTKPNPALAGAEYLRQYVSDPQVNRLPHLAIGGITPRNASDLRDAGCAGIAVSSCICGSPDPALACKELLHSLATPDPERRDT